MDKSEEKPSQSGQATTRDDDDCYILNLDSSSSEESFTSGKEPLKRPASCVVIDSESEDESGLEKKKVKIWEVSSEDEAEENLGTGKQPTIPKPEGVIVIDDNGKSKISVKGSKVKEGKSSDKADSGRQKRGPSQKKPITEQCKIGNTLCKIPGCFLSDIVKSKQYCGRKFKQNRDELVEKIYALLNRTIFEGKLPEKIEVNWNKRMRQTAGVCITIERLEPKRERYAKIAISPKVCDSADRIRDTLVHEVCHAASWLLDGIRDSHGALWQYYAQKCNTVHPELPKVTRCHNYSINYKIYYECSLCKCRFGRYSRSLNTDRFICAKCTGRLILLPLFRKDGTPIVPHVRPFAKYVQENYRAVFKGTAGISHGDVMKRLSKDYLASKQKKSP